ncbi:DUF2339 domain-containing protein [Dysgonomonas sp. Marseille-P4677]|uniref:DUF2339 domain-containing protein n=1 Tax=Dysgonomonas sp. Marseille-P4677 TaxID=2364790 RepID=UPI001913A144|nr:DUF2339 domain-containing protein [Dysgonomonas sp. Marseille-P4677]MBK5719365.1 DUF2339 domain-containing protein [Dysgonomonas sp. Marseille-P4677]
MEEFLIFLLVMVLIALFIMPIVILVKISLMNKDMSFLKSEIKGVNNGFKELKHLSASKEDIQKILDILDKLKNSRSMLQPKVEEAESLEDIHLHKVIEESLEVAIKPQTEEVEEENVVTPETIKEPIVEKVSLEVYPQQDTSPSFAAISNPQQEERFEVEEPSSAVEQELVNIYNKESEKNFIERILGENWLSKVGIITLVLGIAFFVKYAIDQEWINEIGRVGIGLLTGGLIVGIAHKLRSKYQVFSSILVGGGISVFYITITLAFREYELFNQTVAFILLIFITICSVILSLLYDRKELAIFSLLGGFASPLMISTGAGNYIVLFLYLFILNSGMLVISLIKKWRIIGIISYILTLIFFWVWTIRSFDAQFGGATLFAVLFFCQFYLLAIIEHFKSDKKVTAYQAILILSNNLSVFLACLYIFDDYAYDVRGIVTIAIAVVNAIIMLALFRKSEVSRNLIYLIIAVVMTFVSLAIPIQLRGHVITMFWAAEAVLLLWLWQRSQINVFRAGFLLISALTIVSYIMDINHNYTYDTTLPILTNRICITGIVVIAGFVINSFLLRKEDTHSDIEIRGIGFISVGRIVKIFSFFVVILTFVVPYLELNYQLERFTDSDLTSSFRYLALATYTSVYIALLAFIYKKKLASGAFTFLLLFLAILLYAVAYSYVAIDLRMDIFYHGEYSTNYFLLHFLSLPAVAYIIYLLVKNVKALSPDWFTPFCWVLVISSVAILSVELDHVVILLFGYEDNYFDLLYDVHTFGYPILWGFLAMILMIWGLNGKEVLLRKISLIFFGLIILKFYGYDVWYMSQTGRIVSFVVLGVILLLVSFLQQKIKVLMKDDTEIAEKENKEQE